MMEINLLGREFKGLLGWHQARMTLLAQFVLALIKVRTVNLTQVAQAFAGSAKTDSNYKRLQRFLRAIPPDRDLFAKTLTRLFCPEETWVLSMDRTNWKLGITHINFLVLAVVRNDVAIPILWSLLPKQGNSNTQERQRMMDHFIRLFGVERITYLAADREFRGRKWLRYLRHKNIPFCLRIPNNTKVLNKHANRAMTVSRLFSLRDGECMAIKKPRKIWGTEVYLACVRSSMGRVVVISSDKPEQAIERYRRRWGIETLFGCVKTRGFDLEATHLRDPERLSMLFFVVTLTFGMCFKTGLWQHQRKSIGIKKHGRRAKSIFRTGLDVLREILLDLPSNVARFFHAFRVLSCT